MANKFFCDYCAVEISISESKKNLQYEQGHPRCLHACNECAERKEKIREEYQVKFDELQRKMEGEMRVIAKLMEEPVRWSFWKAFKSILWMNGHGN